MLHRVFLEEGVNVIHQDHTVFVLDSDALSRNAVHDVICRMNLRCRTYASGLRFLQEYDGSMSGCLVSELRVSDIGGLEVQRRLATQGATLPVVFLTAHATVAIVVQAMREGAIHFLEKPFEEDLLWETVQKAVFLDRRRRAFLAERDRMKHRVASLTPGEREVWRLWARDQHLSAIAETLGISLRAVESRQNSVLRKLGIKASLGLLPIAVKVLEEESMEVDELSGIGRAGQLHERHGVCRPWIRQNAVG